MTSRDHTDSGIGSKKIPLGLRILNLGPLLSLAILSIFLGITTKSFMTFANLINLMRQTVMYAIIAMGASFMLIGGGIDLSIGSTVALTGTLAIIIGNLTESWVLAILVAITTGIVCGAINGFIVTRFGLMPFIVTLATQMVYRGLVAVLLGGYTIPIKFEVYKTFAQGMILEVIPVPLIIMFILFIVGHILLKKTKTGRYIHAMGSNENTARLAGINVKNYRIVTFIICGICAACTGIILTGRVNATMTSNGEGYEGNAIAAAVMGGTSMSGGEGKLIGTFIGALIMAVVYNGLNLLRVDSYWHNVFVGIIILIAVIIDKVRLRMLGEVV